MGKRKEEEMKTFITQIYIILILMAVNSMAGYADEPPAKDSTNKEKTTSRPLIENGDPNLSAIIKHIDEMYRSESSISLMTLIVTKPRNKRTLSMKTWTKGEEKALVVIQSPPREKGTATLKIDRNLWNYLPRIKRTIRIPPSMMLASWMGSDFTNDDIVHEASFHKDYNYSLIGQSEDPNGWLIELEAKPDIVGLWKKLEIVVSKDGRIPLVARYFDRKGRLARTFLYSEVKNFNGHIIPSKLTLIPKDKDKKGHKTEIIYEDIDFNVPVSDRTFSLSNLERIR
jgi:outer membrane lipoprotein-sorting protein